MPRLLPLPRQLAAALAIAALAAPTAAARPIERPAARAHAAQSERAQDLRHLQAGGTIRTSSYDNPAPIPAARSDADDGTPWMTIPIAVAGVCLLIVAAVALTGRIGPRSRSARATAYQSGSSEL
jgi:hypothetical protein